MCPSGQLNTDDAVLQSETETMAHTAYRRTASGVVEFGQGQADRVKCTDGWSGLRVLQCSPVS